MKNIIIIILMVIILWISGFLMGFGVRGLIEYNRNKNVKGYKSFWDKEKEKNKNEN